MKVLLINGSPRKNGNTATALAAVAKELAAQGIEPVFIQVGNQSVRGCIACGGCRRTPGGLCVFTEDPVNECVRLMAECDGLVIGSPVYYSGIAGTMKSFLDRFFYCDCSILCLQCDSRYEARCSAAGYGGDPDYGEYWPKYGVDAQNPGIQPCRCTSAGKALSRFYEFYSVKCRCGRS